MPTLFLKGDLFQADGARTFGVACPVDGTMGSGVAIVFAKRFVGLQDAYAAHCTGGAFQLGSVFTWHGEGCTVHVLGTVASASSKPKLAPLARALERALDLTIEAGHDRISVPRLGAGLDRVRAKRLLDDASKDRNVTLMVYEQFVRNPSQDGADADGAHDD